MVDFHEIHKGVKEEGKSGIKRKSYKRPCYAKEHCISARPNYGNLLYPVCPVLREMWKDYPQNNISEIISTGLPLLDAVNRIHTVFNNLSELKPNSDTIILCAHKRNSYEKKNFLTELLNPILDDMIALPEKLKNTFPSTAPKLEKLINNFMAVIDSYTIHSQCDLYLLPPSYYGCDIFLFDAWRKQLTESQPKGIVDYGGANQEPDDLVRITKRALTCTFPVDAILTSKPIYKELEEIAKHLDREKSGYPRIREINTAIDLLTFMQRYCVSDESIDLKSKREMLQKSKKIQLPELARDYIKGSKNIYWANDLIKDWNNYCIHHPTLPPLDMKKVRISTD